MATVKVKVFYGPNYERCKVISIDRDALTAMAFFSFSKKVRGTVGYENSSMRIQYRDDEQTFVTMNTDEYFEDALRCICPVMSYENLYRLCIRVDDSLTPTFPAKKKQCAAKTESTTTISSKKKLDFALPANEFSPRRQVYYAGKT
jgi:hypothetical protein